MPIYLLNVPICTQGMPRTWWPEAGTIIVTGPYSQNQEKGVIFQAKIREILKKGKTFACICLFSSGFSYIKPETSS